MSKSHPSGRPRSGTKRGVSTYVRWPRDGFLNPRLEKRDELAGGFGFRMPEARNDHLHHVALATRKDDPAR